MKNSNNKKHFSISEVALEIELMNKSGKPNNHTLRFWEKKFKEIRPMKINNHRYFTAEQVAIIKLIKYLLKDQKITIDGVKKILNRKIYSIDDYNSSGVLNDYYKKQIKDKTKNLLKRLKNLRKNGKKNTH